MNEHLPAPEFNDKAYARPNQNWLCGRAAEGDACRIGPDGRGRCRATFECTPRLDIREGEEKGHYHCTRPKEYGGPCALGPGPDGTCGRPVPKCQPVRSLRSQRRMFTFGVFSAAVAASLILLHSPGRLRFINPGEISAPHSLGRDGELHTCVGCHSNAPYALTDWIGAALHPSSGMLDLKSMTAAGVPATSPMDRHCQQCHPGHDFHHPHVAGNPSCGACHQEHRGTGALNPRSDTQCVSCHGDGAAMAASSHKSLTLAAGVTAVRHPRVGGAPFLAPRRPEAFTNLIHAFARDHPDFRLHTERWRETNTLRFNHARHFAADIPALGGKKLECLFCHKPDAAGVYHEKPTYQANCQLCHRLQFDSRNPALLLPHGDPAAVRAFLRSLPVQYADYGRRERGLVNQRDLDAFVTTQLQALQDEMQSELNLEEKVFLTGRRSAGPGAAGANAAPGVPRFHGCAFCHETRAQAGGAVPIITPPFLPDRWLTRVSFNHARHTEWHCLKCHDAQRSHETADIILPHQASCVSCHSPQGGTASHCSSCHSYHQSAR